MKPSPWTGDKYGVNSEAFVVLRCAVPESLVLLIQSTSSSRETAIGGRGENMPTNQQQKPSTEAEPSPAGCGVVPLLTSCLALPCAHPCLSHSPTAPPLQHTVGWSVRCGSVSLGGVSHRFVLCFPQRDEQ